MLLADEPVNFDSQWNMASAMFYRMHLELLGSNNFGRMGNYVGQLNCLYNLHKELSGQMKPDELVKTEELHERADKVVRSKGIDVRLIQKSLYDYEVFMRKIMKDRKMDLPRSKDPGRAMLEG